MNYIPPVTKNLLIINALFFLGTIVAESYQIDLNQYLGLHFVLSEQFNTAQFFTYMFMHGSFSHLFFNMFAVWMFGRILEQVWGPKRFLFYYLLCGIGAGIIQELVTGISYLNLQANLSPDIITQVQQEGLKYLQRGMNYIDPTLASLNATLNGFTVGASGAVYAILLAFGMLFPNEPLFIFPLPIPIKSKYFVIGYALIELFSGLSNNPGDNVAHFAHLGGMIFGFLLIIYWRKKNRKNGYYYN
ncbi:rhomboid family protein [gut metagenome]|uniref:Rhomboid family protein n=1 Tax=gut metagenome TaxID=749906 RepID=J9GCB6_9ZZZZ